MTYLLLNKDSDFIVTARALLTDPIRQDLLNLKDFQFAPHATVPISAERLDLLNGIVQHQLAKLLA